jgi:hypothetical protein
VIPSGHYALCGIREQLPEPVFASLGPNRLEAVWQGNSILGVLTMGLPEHPEGVCAGCLVQHRSLGSCSPRNYYRAGRLWAPFWFCEEPAEAGLFPTTRFGTADSISR